MRTMNHMAASTPHDDTDTPVSPIPPDGPQLDAVVKRYLEISEDRISAQTDWYQSFTADDKSLLNRVFEAAVRGFIEWARTYESPKKHAPVRTDHIFFVAPLEFMRSVKLSQTLDATRIIVEVIADNIDLLASDPTGQRALTDAALIYSRSVAFSAAEVYANAAEVRGTWYAQDEAFVIESLVSGDTGTALQTRLASFMWTKDTYSIAFVGHPSDSGQLRAGMTQDRVRRKVSALGGYICISQHHDLLITLIGGGTGTIPLVDPEHSASFAQRIADSASSDPSSAAGAKDTGDNTPALDLASGIPYDSLLGTDNVDVGETITIDSMTRLVQPMFDASAPLCYGPVRQGFEGASQTIRAAIGGYRAAVSIPDCPRPLSSMDVLPERALFGDLEARQEMYHDIYLALKDSNSKNSMLRTVTTYLFNGGSLDKTAQQLSVHPNTVKYRLRRSVDLTGWDPTNPREAYVMLTALKIGMCIDANPEM